MHDLAKVDSIPEYKIEKFECITLDSSGFT